MKLKFLCLALALAGHLHAATPDAGLPPLQPLPQQSQAAQLTATLLSHYHYKPVVVDDALSEKIFDQYFKALDPDKLLFLQADIDRWGGERTRLDDAILQKDLAVPFGIFNLYAQRMAERFSEARALLRQGFDFSQDESYQFGRAKAPWPKTEAEARELWRKRVKNDWLQLKLAGKDDKGIAETLDKRYEAYVKRIRRLKSEDAFQVFMNAFTMAIEPHTNYLGPRASENFDISMRLSLVGIGAVLEDKDEYATVRELVPGGPAAISGRVRVGDRIVGVAQGSDGAMADVLGWRLDDTVALIRGAADSTVRLEVLPAGAGPDGKHQEISLVRKKISLEQQAARKSILDLPGEGGRRIGVITLPAFYEDFAARQGGDRNYRSATRDVARLLAELKKEKVDGILVDLRNNGGGSLREAIDLTGLFIDTGPVVQERDAKGRVQVDGDSDPGAAWEGPLGVLINRGSASASEIFAAAIQDYGRGVIVGDRSYGKGTVQTLLSLDQIARSDKQELGEVKLTIAQFFRVDGGTTQLRGVTPDIRFPALGDVEDDDEGLGEAGYDNALPWMRIRPVAYDRTGDLAAVLPRLRARHVARIKEDTDFRKLQEDMDRLNQRRRKNTVSLKEADRRREKAEFEAVDSHDSAPGEKKDKDPFLQEAARILGDEAGFLKGRGALVAGVKAATSKR